MLQKQCSNKPKKENELMTTETINLTKGARLDLSKAAPSTSLFAIGLGWDTNKYNGSAAFDLDASAFLLKDGKAENMGALVYYGKLKSDCGSVLHMGDNLTGEGDGDDEIIKVDTTKIDTNKYNEVEIAVTIYDAVSRNQTFGQVDNAFIRIYDPATNKEICKFDLTEDYSGSTAVVVGKLYFKEGTWRFQAVGGGYTGGLAAICTGVGLAAIGG
jgi:tellurium resistance protein TerD